MGGFKAGHDAVIDARRVKGLDPLEKRGGGKLLSQGQPSMEASCSWQKSRAPLLGQRALYIGRGHI